jgi:hypothetical protein
LRLRGNSEIRAANQDLGSWRPASERRHEEDCRNTAEAYRYPMSAAAAAFAASLPECVSRDEQREAQDEDRLIADGPSFS